MKQSVRRYKVGNMVKVTNRRHNSEGDYYNERWPENTICVVTNTSDFDGDEDQILRLLAISGNDSQMQYNYYADEVSPYPSNADMVARMTDEELSDFLLNWLRSPYSAVDGK